MDCQRWLVWQVKGASQVVKKISGSGQRASRRPQRAMTGGFLIPQDKIQKLIDNKHLLTNKQKEQILSALQSGGQIVVKPSKKQSGGLLGTMLASIGIPLAIEAVKSVFGKGAPRIGRPKGKGAPRIGRPKGGKGAPRLGGPAATLFSTPSSNRGELGAGDLLGTWDGEKKIQKKEKDFCWDRKAHSTTSQFSGRYCECETKIREQTPF